MKHNVEKETLTVYFEGEVNSLNASAVEAELNKIFEANTFKAVRLDFADLVYISSAGLRIIIKTKQQYDDTALVNVPDVAYDVFQMVGFPKMMTIERKAN